MSHPLGIEDASDSGLKQRRALICPQRQRRRPWIKDAVDSGLKQFDVALELLLHAVLEMKTRGLAD